MWFIDNEAILRETQMNSEGKNVTRKFTLNSNDFKNEWDSMGLSSAGKKEYFIDEVHLIYHGAPQFIGVSDNGVLCSDSSNVNYTPSDIAISDLDPKTIGYLNLSSCNSGNLDFNSEDLTSVYGDNMALAFLKSDSDIGKITAWDGLTAYYGAYIKLFGSDIVFSWEKSTENENFDLWSETVNGYKRKAGSRSHIQKELMVRL